MMEIYKYILEKQHFDFETLLGVEVTPAEWLQPELEHLTGCCRLTSGVASCPP